jgi:outer membrane protein TolC
MRGARTAPAVWWWSWWLLAGLVALSVALAATASGQTTSLSLTPRDAPPAAELPVPPADVRLIEDGRRLPIDLPTALALAGAKNLDVLEAKARLAEAAARKDQALGGLAPDVYGTFVAFGDRTSGQTLGVFTDSGRPFNTVTAAGGLLLSLNPAQAILNALAARRSLAAASHDSAEVTQDALAEAAIGYFALQRAQAEVQIATHALAASRELGRVAGTRESMGAGLKVDVLKAQARVAADQIRLSQAGEALRTASARLAVTLTLDPTVTLVPLDTSVRQRTLVDADVPVDALIRRVLAARPAMKAQAERVRAAEESRRAAWSKALAPTLYGNIQHNNVGELSGGQFNVGFIGVQFSLGAVGAARVAAAHVDTERIRGERLEQTVTAHTVVARDQAVTAAEQVDAALAGLRAAEGALDLAQTRFAGGVGIALDVLDSQAALVEARMHVVAAIVGYDIAQIRLLQALGEVSADALIR